jgi:hypothetical protein
MVARRSCRERTAFDPSPTAAATPLHRTAPHITDGEHTRWVPKTHPVRDPGFRTTPHDLAMSSVRLSSRGPDGAIHFLKLRIPRNGSIPECLGLILAR